MAHTITVPRLGWSMEEGTFGEWLKKDGDKIAPGDALFVLEGEKSAQDIESLDGGTLRIPPDAPRPGDIVRVGQLLGYLVADGETAPFENGAKPHPPGNGMAAPSNSSTTAAPPAGPAARRLARGMQVDLDRVSGSGPGGKVTLDDVHAAVQPAAVTDDLAPAITPRARRAAAELGVDTTSLAGSGRAGRIRERDVVAAARSGSTASRPRPEAVTRAAGSCASENWLPVTPIRRTIASRMLEATHETAPVTISTRCDATNLVNLREQFRQAAEEGDVIPSYNDLLVKLTAAVLARHPQLRQQWHDRGLYVPQGMHLAVAVDTEAGLLAPVLRDVDRLTIREVSSRFKALVDKARSGRMPSEDLQGGVFTITNLGMFGIDAFTPIINLPQCAILGIGRIERLPAVVNEAIVPRDQLMLSLTFDHRVVDGAPASRFLQSLSRAVESPGPHLVP